MCTLVWLIIIFLYFISTDSDDKKYDDMLLSCVGGSQYEAGNISFGDTEFCLCVSGSPWFVSPFVSCPVSIFFNVASFFIINRSTLQICMINSAPSIYQICMSQIVCKQVQKANFEYFIKKKYWVGIKLHNTYI